jgi:tetratricopeptide (TPR) repeat protein
MLQKGDKFLVPARENFILASRLQPGSSAVLSEIVKIDYKLKDQSSAEKHAAALLRLDRDNALANYVMGSIRIAQGELASAEDYLQLSAASNPTSPIYNDLAEVLRMQKKYDQAEVAIQKSLKIDTDNAFAHDTLASILLDSGRLEEAAIASKKAKLISPEVISFKLTEARILALRGHKVEVRVLLHELDRDKNKLSPQQRKQLEEVAAQIKDQAEN